LKTVDNNNRPKPYSTLFGTPDYGGRRDNLARVRELLQAVPADTEAKGADTPTESVQPTFICPDCGAAMIIVEILARKQFIRAPPRERGAP
jgi:predicted RNA-binding Zn-ribbon protein involved in translation (DUF1610 family)